MNTLPHQNMKNIMWFSELTLQNVSQVGGKNASLGELYQKLTKKGIRVPNGFAISVKAYSTFLNENNIHPNEFFKHKNEYSLEEMENISSQLQSKIKNGIFPSSLEKEILDNYLLLSKESGVEEMDVAVRSSSTAEDLPDASFAGQQDTYLNVRGPTHLLQKIKDCFASLFNVRAISYRFHNGYDQLAVKLSVTIQKMVRADIGSAGVSFSIDTETGHNGVILINSSWGLGEMVVGGKVAPDEYLCSKVSIEKGKKCIVSKSLGNKKEKMVYSTKGCTEETECSLSELCNFSLPDEKAEELATMVYTLEKHYQNEMGNPHLAVDVEWALDGIDNQIYIVQTRPETVKSKQKEQIINIYTILSKNNKILNTGIAVGDGIAIGKVKKIPSLEHKKEIADFQKGDILVTSITDPDWEPIMKKSGGIITERGGRTCHAAIVAREMGKTAIVGIENICSQLNNSQMVSLSCCEGEKGILYDGEIEYLVESHNLAEVSIPVKPDLMLNVGSPEAALQASLLPNNGVGLAREEFIINNFIGIHPNALLHPERIDEKTQIIINEKIRGYKDGKDYFVSKLRSGISRIAVAFYPKPVIVRFSDFKSNEYRNLIGGEFFEPHEENPMIGWRGASRYYHPKYEEAFGLECEAIRQVREEIGLDNVIVMIPFCRTVNECKQVKQTMKKYGLEQGKNGLKVYLMCELPSNVILAEKFLYEVDGFSIGSNDLTQLTLGLDRDSTDVSYLFDERNDAVKAFLSMVIPLANRMGKKIGICGQGPSDYPDFSEFLCGLGINSISVTSDAVFKTITILNKQK